MIKNQNIPSVLSIGGVAQDIFLENSPEFRIVETDSTHDLLEFQAGSKVNVNKIDFASGGGASNAAVTFARQGLDSHLMGVVGADLAGEQVLKELDEEIIETSRIEIIRNYNTDCSVIIISPNGERTIFSYRGANSRISDLSFHLKPFEFDWIYVTNLSGKIEMLNNIFHEARDNHVKIFWNPGNADLDQSDRVLSLLEDVDFLQLDKQEAQKLFGNFECEELIIRALNIVKNIIITDGENGVWVSDGKKIIRAGMYEDVVVVDRTGAGDAFGSGFLSQFSQGADLKQSILFGSANSTSVVKKVGAKAGILRRGVELHLMPMSEKRIDV